MLVIYAELPHVQCYGGPNVKTAFDCRSITMHIHDIVYGTVMQ